MFTVSFIFNLFECQQPHVTPATTLDGSAGRRVAAPSRERVLPRATCRGGQPWSGALGTPVGASAALSHAGLTPPSSLQQRGLLRPASHPLCAQGRHRPEQRTPSQSAAQVLRRPDLQPPFSSSQRPGLCRKPVVTVGLCRPDQHALPRTDSGFRRGLCRRPHTVFLGLSFSGGPVLESESDRATFVGVQGPDLGCCRVGSRGAGSLAQVM